MSLNSQDQTAELIFNADHKISALYNMVTTEQDLVVKKYDKPASKKSVATQMYFRGQVEESRKLLLAPLPHSNCISFDQSYFTRTIGQLQIQEKLEGDYSLYSGAGFGVIQAFWGALGRDTKDLAKWFVNDFRKAFHKGAVSSTSSVIASLVFDVDNKRFGIQKAKSALRKLFSDEKRDLLVRDCVSDVFIPVQDISGRIKVVNKQNYSNLPIYLAISASLFDPVFFKTKPQVEGLGVMTGDVAKNNDIFMRATNPHINITSVGSPVRLFDKGGSLIKRDDLSLKVSDQKHTNELFMSSLIPAPYTRYQCNPIDECYQFATDQEAMSIALTSGDI